MFCHRFDEILASLRYKNRGVHYEDGLFYMSQMEEAWNKNISYKFNPYWFNVLDEIMMGWYNNFAPVFMCVGRKQHPFDNDRHKICCGLISIFGGHRLSRGRIDRHSWAKISNRSLEEVLDSCFGCASLSFLSEKLLRCEFFLCCKCDCWTFEEGSVCWISHQEAPILAGKCCRGSQRSEFSDKEVGA